MYDEINASFIKEWSEKTHQTISIKQSHGGSGKQARAVMDGLEADVVTLALMFDVDQLVKKNLIASEWKSRLPYNSVPFTSIVVFLVRRGNPKAINDWGDLVNDGVSIVTPNPKTSGGARWNYLAAWGYAAKKFGGDEAAIKQYMRAFWERVPVLDAGARTATTSFTQRHIGDVLVTWESEARLAVENGNQGEFQIVIPSVSIRAETPVSIVDTYAKKHGTEKVSHQYLEYLFSPEAQKIAAKHHFRPRDESFFESAKPPFPPVTTFTIDEVFGGWDQAQAVHFGDGGMFDSLHKG